MSASRPYPLWHLYARESVVYVPNVAQTEAGYFLDVEPVRVMPATEPQAIAAALEQALGQGNPRIPTPVRASFPKPVVLKYAGVKSWKTFEQRSACFTLRRLEHEYELAVSGYGED